MSQTIITQDANSQFSERQKQFFALLALFIIPISGLGIDIYVPSLPAVSHFFGVEKALVQLTVTAYMVGLGIMQLFAGGISDSYGRRYPFLISMFLYLIATLLIPFSHTIQQLISLRFVQGLTVGLIIVPMRSIISDLFQGKAYYKMINYMTMAWSIGPIIAPAIGGYLQSFFGWQANFYFLAIYSFIGFILVAFYLKETSLHHHPFHIKPILLRYREIIFHKNYLIALGINGLLYSIIILFTIVGPFLIQTVLKYSAIDFGHVALLTGLAWFLGGMTNRFLLHIDANKKSKLCFSMMLAISIIGFIIDIIYPMNIYLVVLPIIFILYVGGIVFPNYFAKAMHLFPKMSASANALFGSFLFLIAGLASGLGTLLKSTTEIPLMITYIVFISLCLALNYLERKINLI